MKFTSLLLSTFAVLLVVGANADSLADQRGIYFTLSAAGDDLLMVSRTLTPGNSNQFQVEYMANPSNQFSLETRSKQIIGDAISTFKMDLRFKALYEYIEVDGIPGLSAGDNNTANHPINIGQVTIVQLPNTTDSSNNVIYNFLGSSPNTTSGVPVFQIRGRMVSVQTVVNGVTIVPSSHKFDLILTPTWTPTAGARMALACYIDVVSGTGFSTSNSSAAGQTVTSTVHLGDPNFPTINFNWVPTVTINGGSTSANVIVGSFMVPTQTADQPTDPNTNRKIVYFSFDTLAPTRVEWDPSVSLGSGSIVNSTTTGAAPRAATTGGGVVVMLGLALLSMLAL